MRWFKTPEEYLASYTPERRFVVAQKPISCPRCGSREHWHRSTWGEGRRWRCRCKNCLRRFEWDWEAVTTYAMLPETPEGYVLREISEQFKFCETALSVMGFLPGGTQPKGPGVLGGLAMFGAFSSNMEVVKDSILYGGLRMLDVQSASHKIKSEVMQFNTEYRRALGMADAYFGITARQQAAQQAAEDERMREMARVMAQEMVAEVRRQSQPDSPPPSPEPEPHEPLGLPWGTGTYWED